MFASFLLIPQLAQTPTRYGYGFGATVTGAAGDGAPVADVSKVSCQGPEDCDDNDPCTLDDCGTDGLCTTSPKCGPTEKCCDGACGQCCNAADCADAVACTTDACFAGPRRARHA